MKNKFDEKKDKNLFDIKDWKLLWVQNVLWITINLCDLDIPV